MTHKPQLSPLTPMTHHPLPAARQVNTFMHADVGIPLPRAPAQPLPFKMNLRCGALQDEPVGGPVVASGADGGPVGPVRLGFRGTAALRSARCVAAAAGEAGEAHLLLTAPPLSCPLPDPLQVLAGQR
jgi:hypothetical protein